MDEIISNQKQIRKQNDKKDFPRLRYEGLKLSGNSKRSLQKQLCNSLHQQSESPFTQFCKNLSPVSVQQVSPTIFQSNFELSNFKSGQKLINMASPSPLLRNQNFEHSPLDQAAIRNAKIKFELSEQNTTKNPIIHTSPFFQQHKFIQPFSINGKKDPNSELEKSPFQNQKQLDSSAFLVEQDLQEQKENLKNYQIVQNSEENVLTLKKQNLYPLQLHHTIQKPKKDKGSQRIKPQTKRPSNQLKESHSKVEMENSSIQMKTFTCNCKKSRCLKLYCDCFANNQHCSPNCNCGNCLNSHENQSLIETKKVQLLARNKEAFTPKVDQEENISQEDAEVQLKHTRGCNCKKSGCTKRYCECFQAGIKCNSLCKCETCLNQKPVSLNIIQQCQNQKSEFFQKGENKITNKIDSRDQVHSMGSRENELQHQNLNRFIQSDNENLDFFYQ